MSHRVMRAETSASRFTIVGTAVPVIGIAGTSAPVGVVGVPSFESELHAVSATMVTMATLGAHRRENERVTGASSRVEANLLHQPIMPVEHGLWREIVTGIVPEDRLGLGRRGVHQLRVRLRDELVLSPALQQQRR